MNRIIFSYPVNTPTVTLEFEAGLAIDPPLWNVSVKSVSAKAQDGTAYAYLKGITEETIPLKIDLLTEQERDDLIDFIKNTVKGSYRVFTYTDQDSNVNNVRFLDEAWDFGDGTYPYSVSFTLVVVE